MHQTFHWLRHSCCVLVVLLAVSSLHGAEEKKVRLFLLSGQSNMVRMNPEEIFTPKIKQAFPGDDVIVVKFAKGGKPIRNWVPTWKSMKPGEEDKKGKKVFYEKLTNAAREQLAGRKPESVTFVWMQGERDGRTGHGKEYGLALNDLLKQLQETYGRQDIYVVLGRLSDHGLNNREEFPGWADVRKAQEAFAAADSNQRAIVDTDSFNETGDGLHYDAEGKKQLATRFAEESVRLLKAREKE